MHLITPSATIFWASLSLALALTTKHKGSPQSTWTVLNFRRVCQDDLNLCDISFDLDQHDNDGAWPCSFSINGNPDIPSLETGLENIKCREMAEYSITYGWNQADVILLTLLDEASGNEATFEFREDDFIRGSPGVSQQAQVRKTHDEKDMNYAANWKMSDVARYTMKLGDETLMALGFNIEHDGLKQTPCIAIHIAEEDVDPSTMSFYDIPCAGTKWAVSWGYDAKVENDVAIVTLMNEHRDMRAYFGFRNVSNRTLLGDNGPEPTYPF